MLPVRFYFKLFKVLNIPITKPYTNWEEGTRESMANRDFLNIGYSLMLQLLWLGVRED